MNDEHSPPVWWVLRLLIFVDHQRRCDLARSVLDADRPSGFAGDQNIDDISDERSL